MKSPGRAKVLCVDDDPQLLAGLRRLLHAQYTIATASDGVVGLETLSREGPFAVVVSDMRMPRMDGATFLRHVGEQAPDTVRVLLTGEADMDAAIAAVNEGSIFRFLRKPCSREVLTETLRAAVTHRRAAKARKTELRMARALRRLADALAQQRGEPALWRVLVEHAGHLLNNLEWAAAFAWEDRQARLALRGSWQVPHDVAVVLETTQWSLPECPVLMGALTREGATIVSEPIVAQDVGSRWPRTAWLAIPVVHARGMIGLLAAGDVAVGATLSKRRRRLVSELAQQGATAVHDARAVGEVASAEKIKTEFVNTISHELRTPLNVIIGYAEMLRNGAAGTLTKGQARLLAPIAQRSRELADLIAATLNARALQRDGAETEDVPLEPHSFAKVVQGLEASVADLTHAATVAFTWDVPAVRRGSVRTDPAKLALVLRSLVENAFKFTPSGKVTVRIRTEGTSLVIEVSDTGVGIPPEHMAGLFARFHQVDRSATSPHGGLGLGLYLADHIARQLGGVLHAESELGHGSLFRLVVPTYLDDSRDGAPVQPRRAHEQVTP